MINREKIEIKGLKKIISNVQIFENFNINIEKNKITTIFGPNGSGKTTFLNIFSGLLKKDSGYIKGINLDIDSFSYIFQNYRESLLPWRTIYKNLSLPLEIKNKNKEEIKKEIDDLKKLFELKLDFEKYPYELSGGQQQIVAFMRAVIVKPKILLIDEPFSALDYENNLKLREYLQKYYLKYKPTIILVTHNIEEAVHLSSDIVIFSKKPTEVIGIVENSIKYPRNIDTIKTKQFNEIKDKVINIFKKTIKEYE